MWRPFLVALGFLTFIGAMHPTFAAPVCIFGSVPCWLDCHKPPKAGDFALVGDIVAKLRPFEYSRLTLLDRWTGLVTTPFKCLGVNGWRRYRLIVSVSGNVKEAATSSDGLRTVDVCVDFLDDLAVPEVRYLRAEMIPRVWSRRVHPPRTGDKIRVTGELHWDGHGFLEVHPRYAADLEFLKGN
jgi:hypothetical protein